MGLDCYLKAKRYISQYSDEDTYNELNAVNIPGRGDMRIQYVECEAAYWRKANQIHKWFVDNIQNGVDECQESYVSRENLEDLLNICKRVLEDRDNAPNLLPSQSGFFFGDTEYNEYYFSDIQWTIEKLTKILNTVDETWEFYYQASW